MNFRDFCGNPDYLMQLFIRLSCQWCFAHCWKTDRIKLQIFDCAQCSQ